MDIFGKIKERYYIPLADLADAAESNRIHMLVVSPLIFVFGIVDLILVFVIYRASLKEHVSIVIYFGVFTLASLYAFIHAKKSKNVPREKSYILKTIPFYVIFFVGLSASVFNFYILGHPFNGFVAYCLSGFISLCVFSFSEIPFLIGLVVAMAALAPGIYRNFAVTGLMDAILSGVLMFCISLFKRRMEKKNIMFLKKQKQNLVAKTFGNFTLTYENKVIKFSRSKSNELMGYLIYKKGSSVKTKELISVLWGDHADSARYGSSFRNLIVDIKRTLADLEIQNFFIAEYNNFRINPEVIKCDYYDFLSGDSQVQKSYAGEFMSQFSWAEEAAGFLEMKVSGK